MRDLLPSEEEFELLLQALTFYEPKALALIGDEEVLKAAKRLSEKAEKKSENEEAFDKAFGTKSSLDANITFINDLIKETDLEAVGAKAKKAKDDMTLLSAKLIRFRDYCRTVTTEEAIRDLLKP